jgi:hypothetical protein
MRVAGAVLRIGPHLPRHPALNGAAIPIDGGYTAL